MIKYAILATTTVARPSSKNCAPTLSPHRRWRDNERGNIQSKPTHAIPRSLPSPQYHRPVSHRTHPRRSLRRRRVRRASTVRCAYTTARCSMSPLGRDLILSGRGKYVHYGSQVRIGHGAREEVKSTHTTSPSKDFTRDIRVITMPHATIIDGTA
jgi:hypothetical protein